MSIIEILALITILIGGSKLIVLIVAPKSIFGLGKKWLATPHLSYVYGFFAAVVLYFLIQGGLTIIHVLAVSLFMSLLVGAALAPFGFQSMKKFKPETLLKEMWLYILFIIVLLVWGIKELFF